MEKVNVVGIEVDNITLDEGEDILCKYLDSGRIHMVFTPNSEMLVDAVKDPQFGEILNQGDLVIPDGIGVVIASKFYGKPLKERVTGCDLTGRLIELAWKLEKKIYLFGAKPGVAEEASQRLREKYQGIMICGVHDGYFKEDEEEEIVRDINDKETDILLVALGMPKQEKWIYKHKEKLQVKVAMGVGGSIDVLSGRVKRAPEFYQKFGLEWMYRLIKEPSRIGRMMKLPKFILLALYDATMNSGKY